MEKPEDKKVFSISIPMKVIAQIFVFAEDHEEAKKLADRRDYRTWNLRFYDVDEQKMNVVEHVD